jgi:hypothetical protein
MKGSSIAASAFRARKQRALIFIKRESEQNCTLLKVGYSQIQTRPRALSVSGMLDVVARDAGFPVEGLARRPQDTLARFNAVWVQIRLDGTRAAPLAIAARMTRPPTRAASLTTAFALAARPRARDHPARRLLLHGHCLTAATLVADFAVPPTTTLAPVSVAGVGLAALDGGRPPTLKIPTPGFARCPRGGPVFMCVIPMCARGSTLRQCEGRVCAYEKERARE